MSVAFHVQVNDDAVVKAGDESISVLTAMVTYVASKAELELTIGGLIAPPGSPREHVGWMQCGLKTGDRIVVTVVEGTDVDRPVKRSAEDPAMVEQQQRRYFEQLKQRFGADEGP